MNTSTVHYDYNPIEYVFNELQSSVTMSVTSRDNLTFPQNNLYQQYAETSKQLPLLHLNLEMDTLSIIFAFSIL